MSCPCGSEAAYAQCCEPLIANQERANTAEQLMRSRYTAYVLGDGDHLFRSWHPATRPSGLDVQPDPDWLSLDIIDVVDGGPDDDTGVVEFVARHVDGVLHERSRFTRRGRGWKYVDGDVLQ